MHLFKYPQRFGGMQAPCVGFHSGRPNGMGMYQHHIIGQTLFPRAHQRCEGKTVAAEVGENFHHLCGHSFTFAPLVSAWEERLADDVVLVHAHAVWAPAMEAYARGLHTAKALGILEEVHMPIFTSVHQERKQMNDAEAWADFLASYGADRDDALKAYNSMGVSNQVRQNANRIREDYKSRGTPELVVDGKYRISARGAGTHSEMLRIADYLIEQIRAERK